MIIDVALKVPAAFLHRQKLLVIPEPVPAYALAWRNLAEVATRTYPAGPAVYRTG